MTECIGCDAIYQDKPNRCPSCGGTLFRKLIMTDNSTTIVAPIVLNTDPGPSFTEVLENLKKTAERQRNEQRMKYLVPKVA